MRLEPIALKKLTEFREELLELFATE